MQRWESLKKLAKRNAALAMLNAVRLGGVEPNVQDVEPDEYKHH